MNYKSVLFFLGINSLFVSFFSILNILYSIYFDFVVDLNSYLITLIISLIVGVLFLYVGRESSKKITFIIRRPIPNGGSEYWKVNDLKNID